MSSKKKTKLVFQITIPQKVPSWNDMLRLTWIQRDKKKKQLKKAFYSRRRKDYFRGMGTMKEDLLEKLYKIFAKNVDVKAKKNVDVKAKMPRMRYEKLGNSYLTIDYQDFVIYERELSSDGPIEKKHLIQ